MEQSISDKKYKMMTESPVGPLVLKLAVPTVISMLVTSLYNMVDTYFVGQLPVEAAGGVSVVFSLMGIINALGFFFGHGSGNYISRELGKKNYEDSKKMAATGFISAFIVGCFLAIIGLIIRGPLCMALGSTETILPYAKSYMFWILIALPFMMSQLVLNNQLRFQGNAAYAMVGIVSGAILNCGLDPLFINTLNMGVAGAGLATAISQFVSFFLLFFGTMRKGNVHIKLSNFTPCKKYYLAILNGGSPSLARQGFMALSTVVFNFACHPFGDVAIAAFGIVSKIMNFAGAAMIGFGQGFQPVCGFCYGAKKYDRVRSAFNFSVWLSTGVMIAVAIGLFILAQPLTHAFNKSSEVVEIAYKALRWHIVTLPLSAWVVMANMMFQTMGKALPANFLAMSRQGIFMIPMCVILPNFFALTGLMAAQTVSDVLAFSFAVPMIIIELNKLKKMQAELNATSLVKEGTENA